MADTELDEEQKKKNAANVPSTKGGWLKEHDVGSAMGFIRQVEQLLSTHSGLIPEEKKKALQEAWLRLGPLDRSVVQQALGSKLLAVTS